MPRLATFDKDGKMYDWEYYKEIATEEMPEYYNEESKRVKYYLSDRQATDVSRALSKALRHDLLPRGGFGRKDWYKERKCTGIQVDEEGYACFDEVFAHIKDRFKNWRWPNPEGEPFTVTTVVLMYLTHSDHGKHVATASPSSSRRVPTCR